MMTKDSQYNFTKVSAIYIHVMILLVLIKPCHMKLHVIPYQGF